MWQRRTRTSKRKVGGVGTIRRDTYNSNSGFIQKDGWWEIRKKVVQRAGGRCESRLAGGARCSAPLKEVHHIRPLSQGGTTTMANLVGLCLECHNRRHGHLFRARG
jgi:5-methylcytosine-specific restriction endonuclease McrA